MAKPPTPRTVTEAPRCHGRSSPITEIIVARFQAAVLHQYIRTCSGSSNIAWVSLCDAPGMLFWYKVLQDAMCEGVNQVALRYYLPPVVCTSAEDWPPSWLVLILYSNMPSSTASM